MLKKSNLNIFSLIIVLKRAMVLCSSMILQFATYISIVESIDIYYFQSIQCNVLGNSRGGGGTYNTLLKRQTKVTGSPPLEDS